MAIITRRTFGTVSSPGRQVIRRRVFAPREEVPQNRPFNIPAETILQEPAQRLLKGDIRPLFHPIPVTPKGESIGEVSRKVFGIPETPPSPGLQETLEFGSPYSIAELAGRYPPSALKEAARTFGVGALTDIPDIETTPINYILPYGISKAFGTRLGRATLGLIARKAPLGREFFDYAGRLMRGDPLPRPSLGPIFRRIPEARTEAIRLRQAPPGRPIAMLEPPGGLPKRIVPQPLTMTPGEIQPIVIPTQKPLFETIPEPGKFYEFPERPVKPVLPEVPRETFASIEIKKPEPAKGVASQELIEGLREKIGRWPTIQEVNQEMEARGLLEPEPITPSVLPRKKIRYDIDKAVLRGDLATLVKAYGGFRFPKTLHEQGELGKGEQFRKTMGKLRPFLRKDAQSLDELLQELKSQHPDLFGSFDKDSDLLDAIKRGELKPRIPSTEELLAELAESKRELRLRRGSLAKELGGETGKILLPFPPARKSIPLPGPIATPGEILKESIKIERPQEVVTRIASSRKVIPIKSRSGITIPKEVVEGSEHWRDLTKAEIQLLDQTRQLEKVAGPNAPKLKEFLIRPREEAVTNLVNEKYSRMKELKSKIIDRFGIRQKSQESAAVQKFGEGRMRLNELQRQFPKKWTGIIQAEHYFRNQYNELLSRLNETQKRNRYSLTPKRKDYFTHFQEAANLFEKITQSERGIETSLAGVSEVTQPGRPFVPFRLPRKGGPFVDDAIQGYARYLNPVLSEIHLTDSVAKLRTFKRALAETTKETRNLNNFLTALRDSADQLALKKNRIDTVIQDNVLGYRVTKTVDWVRRRLGKNAILYNISSAVSNFLPIQQILTEIGPAKTLKAMYSSVADSLSGDFALKNSKFLQRRFKDIDISDIDPRGLQKAEQVGAWLFNKIDELTSRTVWNGLYDRAIRKFNNEQAIQIADEEINKIIQGRSLGEIPTAFTSRLFQIGLQFQTEVNNYINYAFRDIGFKDPVKLTKLFIYAWIANSLFEKLTNRRPLLDPIDAAVEAFQSGGILQGAGRISGEYLSNIPGGQLLADMYPIYGMNVGPVRLPTREKFFGRSQAGRFGPIPIAGIASHPLTSLVTPFGGIQLRKTFEGLKGILRGEVRSRKGKRLFGISGPVESSQSVVFGPYSTASARKFFQRKLKKKISPADESKTRHSEEALRKLYAQYYRP